MDEVEQRCLDVMNGVNVTDDMLEVISQLSKMLPMDTIDEFNRFPSDVRLKVIIENVNINNWLKIIMLIVFGMNDSTIAPAIAHHMAPWVHQNGGLDKMIEFFIITPVYSMASLVSLFSFWS